MKNKKTSWILLPAVLLIWGFLGWKIYEATKDNASNDSPFDSFAPVISEKPEVPDTYRLLLDYPDPFLATAKPAPKNPSRSTSPGPIASIPKTSPSAVVPWPEIQFAGLVKSPKDGKVVGFLSVNGVSHFIQNQNVVGELQIIKLWNDSVKISFGKETRVFRK